MRKLPNLYKILIVVVLLVLSAAGIYWKFFYKERLPSVNPLDSYLNDSVLEYYPNDIQLNYTLGGKSRDFSAKIFQGTVVGYSKEGEKEYLELSTISDSLKGRIVRVLLRISDQDLSENYNRLKKENLHGSFDETYRTYVKVFGNTPQEFSTEDSTYLMSLDDFKKTFGKDTILAVKAFYEYPEKSVRESKFCTQRSYILYCLLADIQDPFNTNLSDFWNLKEVANNNVIVPIEIYDNFVEKK